MLRLKIYPRIAASFGRQPAGAPFRPRDPERGQVLVMVTLMLIPMLGFMGLVTDLGYMQYLKRSAQTAADAAAQAAIAQFHSQAAGSSYTCGSPAVVVCQATPVSCPTGITTPANPIQNGCLYAKQQGFVPGGNQSVTYTAGIVSPPPTAPGVGNAKYWITFRVSQTVPQLFSAVLGNTSGTVSARATAAVAPGADCIYALSRTAPTGVSVGGAANLTASCGIYVNSNSPNAFSTNGNPIVSASEYDVVGGVSVGSPLTPTPRTGVPPANDPLAGMQPPATAPYTCTYTNYNAGNWTNSTLSQGVYCGGIQVKNNTYTLNPGIYILVGGGLTTQSTNSHIQGAGVMFYNTFDNSHPSWGTYGPINLAANSTVSLKAGTTGAYAGILFFQDRNAPTPTSDTFGGGSTAVYEGTIYTPKSDVTMYGNSGINTNYTMLIANTISLVGTSSFNSDYSGLPGGSPIQRVTIIE